VRITDRPKDVLRVGIVDTRIVLMDETGMVAWEDHDDGRMVHRLFEFAVARDSLNALAEIADALERHEGGQPHYASVEAKLIARARLVLAESLPSPMDVARLLARSMQLDIWGQAA